MLALLATEIETPTDRPRGNCGMSLDGSCDIFVLNYNGRRLLPECLPSIVVAAERSKFDCRVTVIDNSSTDGSLDLLADRFPQVAVRSMPNRGLVSFNGALGDSNCSAAVLLNNDIVLDPEAIDPLVEPILSGREPALFLTAALTWARDGRTYDGQKTAVRWRAGLVQATSLFADHESAIHIPGPTASAGAAIAVSRDKFVMLGGFDPLYLPGRLEDLDLCYRAYMAGFACRYMPASRCVHVGAASFEPAFGASGCSALALRNTLLFQWKNLRHPRHLLRQAWGLPLRIAADLFAAPFTPSVRRFRHVRAMREAWRRWRETRSNDLHPTPGAARERAFFTEFHPRRLTLRKPVAPSAAAAGTTAASTRQEGRTDARSRVRHA